MCFCHIFSPSIKKRFFAFPIIHIKTTGNKEAPKNDRKQGSAERYPYSHEDSPRNVSF
ncbi:hypothetical protein GCWU000321_00965 [Dialister invisus DSM 15470]|uniref:Uncharacterized protein n=1 Tax=Dialister invisus DSM 15470 TaxID=592028 RepID=C9LN51_9FIRM|nr:hypothetical protein GCWU000321_00965 [Dialister invisus DSM 15470]